MDQDKKEELPELLSMKYICSHLNIHPNTLRQWVKKGYITCYRVGARRDRRFLKEDIMKMFRLDYDQEFSLRQAEWRREQAEEAQKNRGWAETEVERKKRFEDLIAIDKAKFEARRRITKEEAEIRKKAEEQDRQLEGQNV